MPKPRYATLRTLYNPVNVLEVLDSDALVLLFPAKKTVTGEDVLELHIHGGPATVKAVLAAIPRCSSRLSIRYAEPGEFTRRAFQNNRLDLAQVEALSDTLSAETEQQRRAAVRGNSGKLGRTYEGWRQQLLSARGELEALIDFSEDQHFDESPAELLESVAAQVMVMLKSIKFHEEASHRGELLKRGIRISLIGPPNAGKSSLLNQIVGREASIVSPEAGTTRDIVEVSLDIRGYLCTFADTAGLRDDSSLNGHRTLQSSIGSIEREGIRRAKAKASEADVIIALAYCDHNPNSVQAGDDLEKSKKGLIVTDEASYKIAMEAPYSLFVVNKFDSEIYSAVPVGPIIAEDLKWNLEIDPSFKKPGKDLYNPVMISCKDAQQRSTTGPDTSDPGNIRLLVDKLVEVFERMTTLPVEMEDLIGVTERQRQLLSACSEHLNLFLGEAKKDDEECDIVLAAEHLRSAANCLSRITGRGEAGDVEEVLGVVFEKYFHPYSFSYLRTNDH